MYECNTPHCAATTKSLYIDEIRVTGDDAA